MEQAWLLFIYKVPSEPAAGRIALWRRLKSMGAVYLQSGVCMLPRTDEHIRRLKVLENDASNLGGEAVILETVALDPAQERKVLDRFRADRDDEYREFIGKCDAFEEEIAKEFRKEKFTYAELEEEDAELSKLKNWLQKIRKLDFYEAPLAVQANKHLEKCESELTRYAERVFEINGDGA